MKKGFFIAIFSVFTLVACNQKTKEVTTTNLEMIEIDSTINNIDSSKKVIEEKMYSCPMHQEVQGKLNDKCSKCGMKLTEPVS